MPSVTSVAQRLESLLQQRKEHADAIAEIDLMLTRVAGVLSPGGGRGKAPAASGNAPAGTGRGRRKRRRRSRFAVSGNESILSFVRQHPNATTQEIKTHWGAEGRGGGADNSLSLLTKAKKLKRTALGKGIRGSSYTVA
ncbi:MAG TPA: hypothetical protein VHY37_01445 [Tepidisphaeraceae bacterium]|jgi:hypothetical protein|nr:hypothetical protein [Tepidisphaeraceae bacterium]